MVSFIQIKLTGESLRPMKKSYTFPDKAGGMIHSNAVKCLSRVEISVDEVPYFSA
jgi:hypothetical protein